MPGEGDALLRLAVLAAAALGAISLLLMLQVLVVSQASSRRQRRREAFETQWRPLLAEQALGVGEPGLAAPGNDQQRRWWLQLWTRMQATMRGESHARLNRLLCTLGLDRDAVELLGRTDMRAQLVALACFRELGDPGYWPLLSPLLQARNPIKSLAVADALVTIDAARAMRLVLPEALQRRDWALGRLAWLCRRAGPDAVTPPLLELLRQPRPEAQNTRLLALLPYADARELASWARTRLDDANPPSSAMRAGALQVLGMLRDPADHARILAAARDPDPDIRLAATTGLRAQATTADISALLPLLADRAWAVRQEAAGALATLPGLDDDALQALAADVLDRYGREALLRAIAEARA